VGQFDEVVANCNKRLLAALGVTRNCHFERSEKSAVVSKLTHYRHSPEGRAAQTAPAKAAARIAAKALHHTPAARIGE
jgi:hypothetical protein